MRIYQTPGSDPDQRTLLATRKTWEALAAQMGRVSRSTIPIQAALRTAPADGPVRVTLPAEQASYILRLAATLG